MHYYPFHVSDYIHDTAHLTNEEDLAFRRLLDLYYTQEKPIPNKTHEVARRIRMAKQENAVQTVLEEFFDFDMEKNQWHHKRCDETIAAYQAKAERNRQVGKLGGRPKRLPKETQMVSKDNPNQEPLTNNHKPKKATDVACPDGLSESVWNDFLLLRKAKKLPMTQTALDGLEAQGAILGWALDQTITECINRGWGGFKASWIQKELLSNPADRARVTVPGTTERDPALVKLDKDKELTKPPTLETLARLAALRRQA